MLNNKVILVTGGTSGIGKAIALAASEQRAKVIAIGRNPERLKAATSEFRSRNLECDFRIMDVTSEEQINLTMEWIMKEYGHLDGIVNNAGTTGKTPLLETTNEEFDKLMEVNFRSVFLCCRAAAKIMIEQKRGSIINISSVAARAGGGLLGTATYAASKGAVISFSKAIARELAVYNVRVNVISPGSIDTPLTLVGRSPESYAASIKKIPLGRRGKPEDVASSAILLLSDASNFITGSSIDINGGSYMY
jgi:NAD(P)-dependent dehydrogenase (short-subunit alcohol dehydrogenase family)